MWTEGADCVQSPNNTKFKDKKDLLLKMLWGQAEEKWVCGGWRRDGFEGI